jgi:hypothetical protein
MNPTAALAAIMSAMSCSAYVEISITGDGSGRTSEWSRSGTLTAARMSAAGARCLFRRGSRRVGRGARSVASLSHAAGTNGGAAVLRYARVRQHGGRRW